MRMAIGEAEREKEGYRGWEELRENGKEGKRGEREVEGKGARERDLCDCMNNFSFILICYVYVVAVNYRNAWVQTIARTHTT